eukprot:TRINITY_DN112709_c0_g1_i1.p1 TRINITY_DN112709_c0_g1~~TRINITY_DN112709_c0_g1_i1.p1  ORF type:complete len:585 (+),score=104.12 TRINITY_DN112709_c0_g1_i1:148-1902(+)
MYAPRRLSAVKAPEARRASLSKRPHGPDPKTKAAIMELFRAWDANGNGSIARSELRLLMRFATDDEISESAIDKLMAAADMNKDGVINLEEFIAWIFNEKTGMLQQSIDPSRSLSLKSPFVVKALQDWFDVLDLNHNGSVEYEEFAVAKMLLNSDDNTWIDIDEEFATIGGFSDDRRLHWPEFQTEHCRLLDAIPRPLEEKVSLLTGKVSRLRVALKQADDGLRSAPVLKNMRAQEFLDLLKKTHDDSLAVAFRVLDRSGKGFVNIVELVPVMESLLQLSADDHRGGLLLWLRTIFLELEVKRAGRLTLDHLYDGEKRIQALKKHQQEQFVRHRLSNQQQHHLDAASLEQRATLPEAVDFVFKLIQDLPWPQAYVEKVLQPAFQAQRSIGPGDINAPTDFHRACSLPEVEPSSSWGCRRSPQTSRAASCRGSPEGSRQPSKERSLKLPILDKGEAEGRRSSRSPMPAVSSRESSVGRRPSRPSTPQPPFGRRRSLGGGQSFAASEKLNLSSISCVEFESVLTTKLGQIPNFHENSRKHGSKIAARIALGGWSVQDVWQFMDVDKDGTVSFKEWGSLAPSLQVAA